MNNTEPLLNEEQVWDVLEFAQALGSGVGGIGNYYGYYTPDLLHQNLVRLNNDAQIPTFEKLIKALNNASMQEENLQAYNQWGEWVDMIFKRTINYYANLLSFDLMYVPDSTKRGKRITHKDLDGNKYIADRDIVDNFLSAFDYKAEFKKMVKLMLRRETAFTWLRNNGDVNAPQYTLQVMPQRFCKLTGYFERGMLYDFDLNYFMRAGTDVDLFDPIFKTKFNEYFDTIGEKYIPTNPFDKRDGTFAYWTQTSPIYSGDLLHGAWVFKFDTSNFNSVPFLSSLLKDTILNIPIQQLQYDKDMAAAHAILAGEIKMLDSNEPNATAFSPKNLGVLMNIVKQALGKYVGVGAVPAENVKWYQYKDDNTSMYSDQIKSNAGQGASASRLIYNTDKMSQEEIRNAIITDYEMVKQLYSQFANFLSFYINKLTKWYNFAFIFDGSNYPFEREKRQNAVFKGAEVGIVLNDTVFASVLGIQPNHFRTMLAETHAKNSWIQDLSELISIHTQGGKPGRPTQDDVSSDSRDYDVSED